MLYLTPVLPLGPVSYMCGTTSMALSSFALAKVASLPLMIFYVYLGAATGTLLSGGSEAEQIEENKTLICIGIVLSAVMITCISHRIRKELDKVSFNTQLATKNARLFVRFSFTLSCRFWNAKRRGRPQMGDQRDQVVILMMSLNWAWQKHGIDDPARLQQHQNPKKAWMC